MAANEPAWHREVIDAQVERALHDLKRLGVAEQCYLAGGTGLALHMGHRRSHDLDFFSLGALDPEALLRKVKPLPGFALGSLAPDTLHAAVRGVKVSFLAYPYPLLFPFATLLGLNVADAREIACMKLSAIASRGTRRDFVDLYVVANQYGLPQLLEWFKRKYAEVNYSLTHLLKSLVWFEASDKEPMPHMVIPLDWDEVKRYFRDEVSRLVP